MKPIIIISFLLIFSISYSQKRNDHHVLISIGTSLGWSLPKEITGYNLKFGVPTIISRKSKGSIGIDYESYLISNNYYKGSTLGYFFNFEAKSFRNGSTWIPINFTHKFGLKNELVNNLQKYNELVLGTGIGFNILKKISSEITTDIRWTKTFSKRNTYVTPSIRFIYNIF